MTEAPKINLMLQRLAVIYGVPESTNPQAFVAEYARMMRHYVDSEFEEATERLLASRAYKTWPTIAECIAALDGVRAAKRARALAEQMRQRDEQKTKPKTISEQEQREAEKFVDDCADGKIELGFCADVLRSLARKMRANRVRREVLR